MTFEKTIQTRIIAYLKQRGAYVINVQGNEYQAGVPDLLVCCKGRFIALEVKGPDGHLTKLQEHRLRCIAKAGGIAAMVRSVDDVKEVCDTLKGNIDV